MNKKLLRLVEVGMDSSSGLLDEYEDSPRIDIVKHSKSLGYQECLADIRKILTGAADAPEELIYNPEQE